MREEELINQLRWMRSREAVCPAPAMGAGAGPAHVPTHIPAHVPAHVPANILGLSLPAGSPPACAGPMGDRPSGIRSG